MSRRLYLSVDDYTDKMLKLMAMQYGISRSEVVRNLVESRVKKDDSILKSLGEVIERDLEI